MTMQWVFGQVADHGKQGQLPQVEQGFTREASSKEENNGAWCLWVESLNVLQCGLVMVVNNLDFRLAQNQRSQTRE